MSAGLSVADLRFINAVAARRFAAGDPPPEPDEVVLAEVVAAGEDAPVPTAHGRAAELTALLLRRGAFAVAPLQTAVLVLHCSLSLDGLQLLAPQGVIAGMIRDVAAGGDPERLSRWLEDRSVPSSGGG